MYKYLKLDEKSLFARDIKDYGSIFPYINLSNTFDLRLGQHIMFWGNPFTALHEFFCNLASDLYNFNITTVFIDSSFKCHSKSFSNNNIIVIKSNNTKDIWDIIQNNIDKVPVWILSDISCLTYPEPEKTRFVVGAMLNALAPALSINKSTLIIGNQQRIQLENGQSVPWGHNILSIIQRVIKTESYIIKNNVMMDFKGYMPTAKRTSTYLGKELVDSAISYLIESGEMIMIPGGLNDKFGNYICKGRLDNSLFENPIEMLKKLCVRFPSLNEFYRFFYGSLNNPVRNIEVK